MAPVHPAAAQALAEYALLQLREVLGRVEVSVAGLETHETLAIGAGVILVLFLLLRRGSTNLR